MNTRVHRVFMPRLNIAKHRQVDKAKSTCRYSGIDLSILWIRNIVSSATKIPFFQPHINGFNFEILTTDDACVTGLLTS